METQIQEIYARRVAERTSDPRYRRLLEIIITESRQRDLPLREDAIYFLANNIADMVIGPMLEADRLRQTLETTRPVGEQTLFSYIESDVATILDAARASADIRDRNEISATSVIIGLGSVIERLQLDSTKLWGRRLPFD